ncbi:MAG: nuclease SbcCD, subunit [Frankiales bacterium]|nr:nuclease SbcCD, subunit [Frankiales bacterium]
MLLLHTSDWHLGRSLHRADLRDAQAGFLDHLVEVVRSERVDVVLVSGDVYDRAVPPLDAVALCESAFVRLRAAGAQVVVISGNHDSARRLGFGAQLFDSSGVFLRTAVESCAEPVVIDGVPFFAIPYLEPEAVRASLGDARGHVGVLTEALSRVRAVAPPVSVVLAHAWVAGGKASESERDITVGGVSAVPVSLFDGFTYTALGHLHRSQVVSESLRYSGSPLAYSFSEAGHTKGSWLVSLSSAGLESVQFVSAPVPRRLSTLRGELAALLTDPALAGQEGDYLSVVLTDTARPDEAMARLSTRFPHVLVLAHEPAGAARSEGTYAARVAGRTDLEVAGAFVAHVRGTAPSVSELDLLGEAFGAHRLAVT